MPSVGGAPRKDDPDAQLHRLAEKLLAREDDGRLELRDKDRTFLSDVVERWRVRGPFVFSPAQAEWLEDLEERHL